jgi:cysteine sulfinate desulfinase/cysteine desulfurase-like protein
MIYADNAATTKLDPDAFTAMKPYLMEEYGNASQPYRFSKSARVAIKKAREVVAECIGAVPEEIYFTSCGTESDNTVIKSVLFDDKAKKVVTSSIEHHAILNSCHSIEKLGVPVEYLEVDKTGIVRPEDLSSKIDSDVSLVSIMMANNEIGTIEPIRELCQVAHSKGALFHTDAVQAAGHIHIDVKELGVDMLSASAHKFNGMKGSGFLFVKRGTPLHAFMDGGAQEQGKRAGTENVAAIVAMAVALKKNCNRIDETTNRLHHFENVFLQRLNDANIDFIRNGNERHLPGNINISIRHTEGEMLLHRLDLKGICISTGSACDSVNTQISHVIRAIHVPDDYAKGTIRISLGWENTEDEVITMADELIKILQR